VCVGKDGITLDAYYFKCVCVREGERGCVYVKMALLLMNITFNEHHFQGVCTYTLTHSLSLTHTNTHTHTQTHTYAHTDTYTTHTCTHKHTLARPALETKCAALLCSESYREWMCVCDVVYVYIYVRTYKVCSSFVVRVRVLRLKDV